jgi:hypothetical protein
MSRLSADFPESSRLSRKKPPDRLLMADPAKGGKEQFLAGYLNSRL